MREYDAQIHGTSHLFLLNVSKCKLHKPKYRKIVTDIGCFLDVRKAFDIVWIDGLLFKLFTELGIERKMWLAIKDLLYWG